MTITDGTSRVGEKHREPPWRKRGFAINEPRHVNVRILFADTRLGLLSFGFTTKEPRLNGKEVKLETLKPGGKQSRTPLFLSPLQAQIAHGK